MSQENVGIVRAVIDASNRRRGRDAVFQFWHDVIGTVGGEIELEAVHDASGVVVIIAMLRGLEGRAVSPARPGLGRCGAFATGR